MTQAGALEILIRALDSIGAKYLIAGSLASSAHGIPRFTRDTDLVVGMAPGQMGLLADALGAGWYMDPDFARQSFERGRSFNLIHIPSSHKFDFFPANSEFHIAELERAAIRTLSLPGGVVTCYVATVEDTILAKLRWYRDGGEVSEQQWNDITGILAVNPSLDFDYLNNWARRLNVTELLEKAIHDTSSDL